MKKLLLLLFATGLLFTSCSVSSKIGKKKAFTGKITYAITFPGTDFSEEQLAQLPSRSTLIIGKKNTKSILRSGIITQIEIKDIDTQNSTSLMEVLGQKFAIEKTKEMAEKELEENSIATVSVLDDTKEIAGRLCNKAIIKINDSESTIYFSKDIGNKKYNYGSALYINLNGIPLEYSIENNNIKMKMTAIKIEECNINNHEFDIPEGYQKVTLNELQNMFGN